MTAFRSCTIVDLCEALKKIPQYPTVLKEADTDFTELVKITVYNLCKDRKLWSEEDGMISLPTRFSWTKISELTVQRIMETSAFQLIIAQQQLQQQYSNTLKQKKLSSSSNNSAGDAMNVFI